MPRFGAVWVSPHGPVADLPGEEWRDWEDLWEVSNMGRFKAKARAVENPRGVWHQRERLLTPHYTCREDCRSAVYRYQVDGECRSTSIYQMMWSAFIGPLPEGAQLMCDGDICLANLAPKLGHEKGYALAGQR